MPCNFLWYWVGNFGAMDCGDITIHNRRPADVLAGPYLSNSTTGYRPDFAGRQRKEAHDAPVPARPEFGSAFVVIRDVNTRSMDEEIPTYSNTRGAPTSAAPRDPSVERLRPPARPRQSQLTRVISSADEARLIARTEFQIKQLDFSGARLWKNAARVRPS